MSSEEGLSRAELRTWRRFTSGTFALLGALDRDLRDRTGMSLDDFGVLRFLWSAPDSALRMTDLADEMAFSASRLSHAVQRMEDKGWVRREPSPDDRRVRLVLLTSEGRATFEAAWPEHAALIRELFLDQLDDERRTAIVDVFTRVNRAVRHNDDED